MRKIWKKWLKIIKKSLPKYWAVLMLVFVLNLSFPHISLAQSAQEVAILPVEAGRLEVIKNNGNYPTLIVGLGPPRREAGEPRLKVSLWVTAYNSRASQTDGSPCITASGLDVCERNIEDIVATNFQNLSFGTKVRLPELFGDKIFTIEDRMHSRYQKSLDIWLKDYQDAREFGRKQTVVEIF